MKKTLSTLFLVITILVLLMSMPLWASGDCKGKSCNGDVTVGGTDVTVDTTVSTGDMVGGDTSLSNNSRALALSNGLGDVDIAGCLGSTQWATPVFSKQKLVVNWPCMAEFYLRNGKYELAAMAICNTEIRKEFATEDDCRAAHDFDEMIEEAVIVVDSSEEDEWREEQRQMQMDYEARIEALEHRAPSVRMVEKPLLTDNQRKQLEEVLAK